jgi:hypothetical protein
VSAKLPETAVAAGLLEHLDEDAAAPLMPAVVSKL